MNKRKVWTVVAGAGVSAAVLIPGIVYAANDKATVEGGGIFIPNSTAPAELPKSTKAEPVSANSTGHSFSAATPSGQKDDADELENVEKLSPISANSSNSPVSPNTANSPATPSSPASANDTNSPVSANSPASPASPDSPASAASPASPASAN